MYPGLLVNHRFNYQPLIILPQSNGFLQTTEEKQISSLSNGNSRANDITNSTTTTKKSSKKRTYLNIHKRNQYYFLFI
jgi:hypothetical protein